MGRQVTPSYLTTRHFFLDNSNAWAGGGGESIISHISNGGGVIIGIAKDSSNTIPKTYILKQNYPNPFNSSTVIQYSIISKTSIGINIYDITGKSVYDMTANNQEPGHYKLLLDFGSLNLASGIYFYKFIVINNNKEVQFSITKKMIYLK